MSVLRILNHEDSHQRQAWDSHVLNSADGTLFHTTAWMDVVRHGLGLSPRYCALINGSNTVIGAVPLFRVRSLWGFPRWVNVPQGCNAEPLAIDRETVGTLMQQTLQLAHAEGVRAVVVRGKKESAIEMPATWEAWKESPVHRHIANLSDMKSSPESLNQARPRVRMKYRRYTRRFLESGGKIKILDHREVRRFARVVHQSVLRRHGHIPYPFSFFEALVRFIPSNVRMVLVESRLGNPLGYVLSLWDPPRSHILMGGNVLEDADESPAMIAVGHEFIEATRAGLLTLDMGETGPQQIGIARHKERWGCQRVDGSYQVYGKRGQSSGLHVAGQEFQWAVPWIRRVPLPLSGWLAKSVHRLMQ